MSDSDRLLAEAVAAVYAVTLETFMATRSALVAQAKASGNAAAAKDIARLRRPSVAAWAINNLVRRRPDVVADLIGLGVRMRSAQAALDGEALSALRGPRNAVLGEFVWAASVQAAAEGRVLVASVEDQVMATAVASLADEGAADALASGALIKALSYSGFGEVDISDAVVRTATGRLLSVLTGGGQGGPSASPNGGEETPDPGVSAPAADEARAAFDDAEAELAQAAEALATREREQAEARARVAEAEHLLAQAQHRLERTRSALSDAEAAFMNASRRHRVAERARHSAATKLAEVSEGP